MAQVGRPKAFDSPEQLMDWFNRYKAWVEENPIRVHDYVGKDADEVYRIRQRPLTVEGFENFLFEHKVIADMGDYFKNRDGRYEEFSPICSHIKKAIRQDQIEGGMAGIYNPSITQRLNALTEKVEQQVTQTSKIVYEPTPGNDPIKES